MVWNHQMSVIEAPVEGKFYITLFMTVHGQAEKTIHTQWFTKMVLEFSIKFQVLDEHLQKSLEQNFTQLVFLVRS